MDRISKGWTNGHGWIGFHRVGQTGMDRLVFIGLDPLVGLGRFSGKDLVLDIGFGSGYGFG